MESHLPFLVNAAAVVAFQLVSQHLVLAFKFRYPAVGALIVQEHDVQLRKFGDNLLLVLLRVVDKARLGRVVGVFEGLQLIIRLIQLSLESVLPNNNKKRGSSDAYFPVHYST